MPITLLTERPISGYINAITRNAETLHNNGKQVSRITLKKNGKGQIALQRRRLHGLTSLRQHRQHVASPTKLSRTDPQDGDVAQENLSTQHYIALIMSCIHAFVDEQLRVVQFENVTGIFSASPFPLGQPDFMRKVPFFASVGSILIRKGLAPTDTISNLAIITVQPDSLASGRIALLTDDSVPPPAQTAGASPTLTLPLCLPLLAHSPQPALGRDRVAWNRLNPVS